MSTSSPNTEIPHFWKEGSNIDPNVYGRPKNSKVATCRWQIEYLWVEVPEVATTNTTFKIGF